eukprot:GHVP01047640.1.p2 GENE.GHVP01047640.1~~GHVP01047640.1.p2  ORF type:complete len:214 (+),score=56.85 GHVP01047640.1:1853-2494(+)
MKGAEMPSIVEEEEEHLTPPQPDFVVNGLKNRESIFSVAASEISSTGAIEKLRGFAAGSEQPREVELGTQKRLDRGFSIGQSSMASRSSIFGEADMEDFMSETPNASKGIIYTMLSWKLAKIIEENLEGSLDGKPKRSLIFEDLLDQNSTDAHTAGSAFYQLLILAAGGNVVVEQQPSTLHERNFSKAIPPVSCNPIQEKAILLLEVHLGKVV